MRFVIEAMGLTAGGGKELALDLMTKLSHHREHEFTFIVPALDPYQAVSATNIRKVIRNKPLGLSQRALLLNRMVPKVCREVKAEALLCLGNFPPRSSPCPTVVLLHNPWFVYRNHGAEHCLTLREKLINSYGKHVYRHLAGNIGVIAQTPVMKSHLCQGFGIPPERVAVIPNTFSVERMGENEGLSSPSDREGVGRFTFLCLSHYYPHKNIGIIPEALERLSKHTRKLAKCVITIAPDQHPGARRLLESLASNRNGSARNIGPVPTHRLREVYRGADALLFPTLLESYSRTYLEAMHFGVPILTSDRDFAHHLCGDAAIYFDPLDADSVAKAMSAIMNDQKLRQQLVGNGRRVLAQAPTWEEIAGLFVDALERTARGETLGDVKSPLRMTA